MAGAIALDFILNPDMPKDEIWLCQEQQPEIKIVGETIYITRKYKKTSVVKVVEQPDEKNSY